MTQTLTTELLSVARAMRDYIDALPADVVAALPTMPGFDRGWADEVMDGANREALPVSSECNHDVYASGKSACLVVIPKETAEVICRGISEVTGCKVDWHYIGGRVHIKALTAPPAPAVPSEIIDDEQEEDVNDGWADSFRGGWNACRAAMLAQPVSQRYKLPPHAYRELVNALRDTAVKYNGTDQLRERLNTALSQFIEPDHPHTRPAPQERN